MDNKYLENEIKNNHESHEVFKRQRHSDLDKITDYTDKNDIVLNITVNNIVPFISKSDNREKENYWNHSVSLILMNELNYRYGIKTNHDLEEEKRIITRADNNEYNRLDSIVINRDDVIETIRNLNLDNPRFHIILNYINKDEIWTELFNYFQDDLPFITMIYSDNDIPGMVDKEYNELNYEYIIFDKEDDGIVNHPLKAKTYEKKI